MKTPILVLGFGRSGTTWISDIISKTLQGLILFEPLHPSVTNLSFKYSYGYEPSYEDKEQMKNFINDVLVGNIREPWLLRNHLPHDIAQNEYKKEFIDYIFNSSRILGFKELRLNFMFPYINELLKDYKDFNIVYIIRNPAAVISSIIKRNFWEFGFKETFYKYIIGYNNVIQENYIDPIPNIIFETEKIDNGDRLEIIRAAATMWCQTHQIVLKYLHYPLWKYEDFYLNPFETINKLLKYLGNSNNFVHPHYIFNPSVTTSKTNHGLLNKNISLSKFYEDLTIDEYNTIFDIVEQFQIDIYKR